MRKNKLALFSALVFVLLLASCTPDSSSFDQALLVGKWSRNYTEDNQTKTEFYRYDNDGGGATWVPADDVTEAEGQTFTWVLDKSELTHIYIMQISDVKVTKIYTVTKLTSTTLEYKDDFKEVYTFSKVK